MPKADLNQLGAILRHERVRAGMSLRDAARASGLVASTVSRLEAGLIAEPRPNHLQRLARAFGIDVEALYAPAGYLSPGGLPELRPYLRAKYGLADSVADRVEGYVQALRNDPEMKPRKEGGDDNPGDQTP